MSFPQPASGGTVTALHQGGGIALSSDPITNSGTVALATVPAGELFGNSTTAAAIPQGITLGTNLSFAGNTLNATGGSSGGVTRLASTFTPVANTNNNSEQVLFSYTMPGGTLATNGQAVRIIVGGTRAGGTQSILRVRFGASVVAAIGDNQNSANFMHVLVGRQDNTHQQYITFEVDNGGAQGVANTTPPTETLSGNVVIEVTGQSTRSAANDVIVQCVMIELLS